MRISTADAAVRYPGFTLGPLTIELEPGLTVLVGPSGAGKSTLLAILAGLRPTHEGTVLYNGRNLAAISDRERARLRKGAVSIALQNPLFLDEVDLVANLRRAAELRGERTNDAEQWLGALGLSDRIRNTPAALSGGELSRAATARSLASACPVILLDEPTAMLDEENAKRVRDAIIGAATDFKPRTILTATHDEALIAAADRRWRIRDGRLL